MEWLSDFLDQIIVFFQRIWGFSVQGTYDSTRDGPVVAAKVLAYVVLQTLVLLIDVSYTAVRELIGGLDVPRMVRSIHTALPGPTVAGLVFFGVSQALNTTVVTAATHLCARFVPFIGR